MKIRYYELGAGDVFSINKEKDGRKYMKLSNARSVNIDTREDAIPALYDGVTYHYTLDVHNNMTKRELK